jgi:hypothetical protein
MRATVDAKRHRRLERLLARLRVRCFENEESARLIPIVKAQLAPAWCAEHDRVDVDRGRIYHGAGGGFYQLDSVISRTAVDYAQWLADRPAAKIPA